MRDKQIDMFEDPNIEDQIKLATLTVYNWGSFNGLHSININPDGTLITGENGAGKSTIIDGLMVLLCSAGRVSFNMAAAQGINQTVPWCHTCAEATDASRMNPVPVRKICVTVLWPPCSRQPTNIPPAIASWFCWGCSISTEAAISFPM